MQVELLDGQPLKVHDLRRRGGAPVAQHVGDVLGQLGGGPQARSRRAELGSVEELAPPVALGAGHRPVAEAAREQRHIGAGGREGMAQRVIVGRRVGRGVDDVDAHRRRQ